MGLLPAQTGCLPCMAISGSGMPIVGGVSPCVVLAWSTMVGAVDDDPYVVFERARRHRYKACGGGLMLESNV